MSTRSVSNPFATTLAVLGTEDGGTHADAGTPARRADVVLDAVPSPHVAKGCIATTALHRRNLLITVGDTVSLAAFRSPPEEHACLRYVEFEVRPLRLSIVEVEVRPPEVPFMTRKMRGWLAPLCFTIASPPSSHQV